MKKLKINYFKRSLKFFKNCKWYIVLLTIIDILLGILSFIDPIITAHLITYITTSKYQLVITFILLMLIMLIISNILYYCTNIVWRNKIRTKVLYNIREEMINNVMNLRVSTYDKYTTGLFQERIGNDPIDVARVVNSGQNYFIKCLTQIAVIIYIFCINAIIGIIYLLGMVLSALIDNYKQRIDKENNIILKESTEKSGSLLTEVIRGIRDIKLLNFKNNVKKDVMENMDIVANNISKTDNFYSKITYIQNVILSLTTALVLIIGILFVKRGILTVANLIVLYLYHNNIFSLMDNYSWLKNSLKRYELGIERIFSLNDSNKFPKESFGNIDIENFKGKIELKKVSFGYSKDKLILNNLSLKLEPKDTVAIVGASGSGKTTVLNLITKSYNATGGKVLLDNVNINDISEKTLRENVSIISQNPYIFNMTIKDNLLMVKPDASKEELDKVCKEASIYDYIMSLPKKYDSLIGEGGLNLSGGQRQRLAIARALLKECKILLLDEATSALDNITQNEIQKSIDIITKDYTIIIVAHRLSTIKACNKIYMLDKGKIIASGTHEELLKTCESYQRLYDSETISES